MMKPENQRQDIINDARRLAAGGASVEMILMFFRERGFDKIDSIKAIRAVRGVSTAEAKNTVDGSETWSDRFNHDMEFRETAWEALREIAASQDPSLPKITFDERDHEEGSSNKSQN